MNQYVKPSIEICEIDLEQTILSTSVIMMSDWDINSESEFDWE